MCEWSGRVAAPGAAGRAGRTLRRPPPPLRPGGLAAPCARLGLSLGRRRRPCLGLPPSGWAYLLSAALRCLMVAGSRPGAACGDARSGFRGEEAARGASSGDRDISRTQPLVSPREEFPLYFTVVHPSDVSNNSLRVYRGFPFLLFIQKPDAIEAL